MSTQTPQGALSLALLQSKLLEAEAAQSEVSPEDVTALKQQMADLQLAQDGDQQQQQKGGRSRLLANSVAAAQEALVAKRAAAAAAGWGEEGEGEDWEDEAEPEYQLTFESDGRMVSVWWVAGSRREGGLEVQNGKVQYLLAACSVQGAHCQCFTLDARPAAPINGHMSNEEYPLCCCMCTDLHRLQGGRTARPAWHQQWQHSPCTD